MFVKEEFFTSTSEGRTPPGHGINAFVALSRRSRSESSSSSGQGEVYASKTITRNRERGSCRIRS